jgi:hypothetical protein
VVGADYFFVLAYCHCSPSYAGRVSVDVCPVCFVVVAFVWFLSLFMVVTAAALAYTGFVSCTCLSKISSAVSISISSSIFSIGWVTAVLVAFTTCAVGVCYCPGHLA